MSASARSLPHLASSGRHRRWLALAVGIPLLLWLLACAAVWAGQERLLFRPVPLSAQAVLSGDADVHERFVAVPGARLSLLELRLPDPEGVVFYLHGNTANLKDWFFDADYYRRANFDLVMLDYRGFGKSSGHIASEAQLHADVRAAWDAVAGRYRGRRVVLYGRSLGSGLAARLATQIRPDATVLVSPYASMLALAAQHYPWVPAALLRYPLRSDRAVARLHGPLLLIHGDQDGLIPLAHSETLAALTADARLVRVAGAGHADVHRFPAYREALGGLLAGLRRPGPQLTAR